MPRSPIGPLFAFRTVFLAILGLLLAPPAWGQSELAEAPADPTDPVPIELTTKDGVLLTGTFFAADDAGRDTPIVVMLADEGESPRVFNRLALALQFSDNEEARPPMSVMTVALRGQGDSTRVRLASGEVVQRRGARITPSDTAAMVKLDMEAVRQYLVDKNDAGELNLNRLCYLGVGFGALVATNAAAVDWAVPQLNRGKQGRDVKALILVSPPWKQLGLEMLAALRQPGVQSQVAVLVTYGDQLKSAANDAERIVRQLEKARPPVPEAVEGQPAPERTVISAPGKSRLQGTRWLKQAGRNGEAMIVRFLNERLAEPEYEWTQRRLD
ncbi:Alpha/beta hydrolase family protein [Planctomycetes bacterium MalM25]|nr:Alpha/beta hydrolase family protein [Planctomycetes bacterium MalM25]